MPKPVPFLDLTRQYRVLQPQLDRAVLRVMAGGSYILGREVQAFEKEFARFSHCRFGVGVASGTDALELALRAAGVGPGDGVATVSFTFCATVDSILHVGARPLLADIDPKTFTLDPGDLLKRLKALAPGQRRRMKAVIPVHLYGHPCDMDAVREIARRFSLAVIEDAAQAAGACWKGKPVGSFGDAGCFSFFPTKTLGGAGDGGMVTTNSARLEEQLRLLRVHGRKEREVQITLGRNSRLDELQAAVLRVKLKKLPAWLSRRRTLAREYDRLLERHADIVRPSVRPEAVHAFNLYVIRVRHRDAVRRRLLKAGIQAQVYYSTPVHGQGFYKKRFGSVRLPHTDRACREVLALPLFPELTRAEQERVCGVL